MVFCLTYIYILLSLSCTVVPKHGLQRKKSKRSWLFFLFLFLPLRAQKQFIITLMLLKFGDIETSTP